VNITNHLKARQVVICRYRSRWVLIIS